jgi:DNA-binding response OmpR family regulator
MTSQTGRQILVVDDDELCRDLLRQVLADEGYHVVTATNGRDALAQILAGRPDLVIADWGMPPLPGEVFAREVKASAGDLPLVIVSATVDVAALKALSDDFLAKPFDLDDVCATVRRFCPLTPAGNVL